jgi:hypothetical protein
VHRLRRELSSPLAGTVCVLASLALGLFGCPQLLDDSFGTAPADQPGKLPDTGRLATNGNQATTDAGAPRSRGPNTDAGATRSPPLPDASITPPLPDASNPAPPPDSGPRVCVPSTELCDGRDNDCDGVIDNPPACASGCVGVLFDGRSGMFCGSAGATFADAAARCSTQGMLPVVIDSAQKSTAVLQAVEPIYAGLSTISETQHAIWIDAHDGDVEGTWHWGTNGPVFWIGDATGSAQNGAYVDWAAGKPNNSGSGDGEDCAVMHVGSGAEVIGTWNDDTCDGLHTFFCEAPAP